MEAVVVELQLVPELVAVPFLASPGGCVSHNPHEELGRGVEGPVLLWVGFTVLVVLEEQRLEHAVGGRVDGLLDDGAGSRSKVEADEGELVKSVLATEVVVFELPLELLSLLSAELLQG